MLRRLAPASVSSVPARYAGIFAHGTVLEGPARLVFLAGQIGVDANGETKTGFVDQTHQAMDNVEALLREANLNRDSILRVMYYVTDAANLQTLSDLRQERWNSTAAPAVTTLVVAALAAPDLLVEIEVTAGSNTL
ncbi:MAG: RidA family protein [Pseudomonadota bacterium]